jgi:hypothetical protein
MKKKRTSLVERAQAELDKNRVSNVQIHSNNFRARSEAALIRRGRANATSSSRVAQPMVYDEDGGNDEDMGESGSVASYRSMASQAPSLHPSVMSSYSAACSEVTVGAGDETGYWDYRHRVVNIKDLGHKCRECKQPFNKMGSPLTERRGARTRFLSHHLHIH